jgi:hypothetical protein
MAPEWRDRIICIFEVRPHRGIVGTTWRWKKMSETICPEEVNAIAVETEPREAAGFRVAPESEDVPAHHGLGEVNRTDS